MWSKNDKARTVFIELMPSKEKPLDTVSKAIKVQCSANETSIIEEEMFHMYFDMEVQAHNGFLAVRQPANDNAAGLFECFKQAMEYDNVFTSS